MTIHLIAIILAVMIDRIIGDPPHLPHPVKYFGKMIDYLDRKWNRGRYRKWKGLGMLVMLLPIVLGVSIASVVLAYVIHPVLGVATQAVLIAATIAQKGLKEAALEVQQPLMEEDIHTARKKTVSYCRVRHGSIKRRRNHPWYSGNGGGKYDGWNYCAFILGSDWRSATCISLPSD